MFGLADGSAQANISGSQIEHLEIPLPPLPEQRAIAHILGTLDDKIELNRKMNETLEAIAQALFKSWFVDFEFPDETGKPYKSSVGKMVDSELGEIPEGWDVRGLDEIANYLNGLALQKFPPGDGTSLPVIKIAQLHTGNTKGADRANSNIPPEYVVDDGDVLFSWSGSLECVLWTGGKGALNQHLFKVTSANFPKWFYYLWTKYHLRYFQDIAADKATTMGHIQRYHLREAKVLIPPKQMLMVMDRRIAPLLKKMIVSKIESRTLAALRDTLLPKLLSGELRVKETKKMV